MSPSTHRTTRTRNVSVHPGDAIPRQTRSTKQQMEVAKQAEEAAKKKMEIEKRKKLTNVAQVADNIVLEMQAHEASEPCVRRGRPLKRTYAMVDVTEPDKENQSVMLDSEQSNAYAPSDSIDPASDSDTLGVEPPKKKRGKAKSSILNEIQGHRQHLDPILKVEEREEDVMMANDRREPEKQGGFHFKAGLKKSWVAQKTGYVLTAAPRASRRGTKSSVKPGSAANTRPALETETAPKPVKKAKSSVKPPVDIPETPQAPARPRPRPRPVQKACLASRGQVPDTPLALTSSHGITALPATPVNFGGIPEPEDETDAEEQAAARSSPVKAGKRITSNAIVAIRPVLPTGPSISKPVPLPIKQLPETVKSPVALQRESSVPTFSDTEPEDFDNEPFFDDDEPLANIRKPSNALCTDKPVFQSTISRPRVGASKPIPAPKPQDISKPTEQELVREQETIDLEPEPEPGNERASVAPSGGANVGCTQRPRGSGRSQASTYDCLPEGVTRDTFKAVFMPTITKYLVKLANPWSTITVEFTNVIQCAWNKIFPASPYTFSPYEGRCDVTRLISCKYPPLHFLSTLLFVQITQRIYEWRSKFASAAIDAILNIEEGNKDCQDIHFREEWVEWALRDKLWPFLYADTESNDPKEWLGTFESSLIAQALSSHLVFTTGAIAIKKLKDLKAKWPVGALALATVAVERALMLWSAGDLQDWRKLPNKDKKSLPKFDSTTWARRTIGWFKPISTVTPQLWDDIISTAREHVKPAARKQASSRVIESVDSRTMLVTRPRHK